MPVSLCEWRVRIGTFVHWIKDYEIRERKERLLKERTRRIKVLCERLRAKQGVSEQESGDGSKTSDKSKQGYCNSQDPTDPKVRSRCLHGTAIKQSSGNTSIKDLLTSCGHCIKDLLTPNDSHVNDVLAPSDIFIKELLTPTDSCIEDLLFPSDVCQKNPHTAGDSYSEELMADDCHIYELLNASDSCIKGLPTASDSWEDVPLLSLESYGNEGHTPLESCNKDLLPAHDLFDTWSELQAHSGSYVSNPVNPKDSFIHELLMPRDPNLHNFLKNKDSHISKILTPKDSYIHDLLMSEDSYTIELLKPANFSIKELFTSDSSGVKVPFCIDATITDLPTSTEYCSEEHQITSDSSITEQVTPSNASKEHTNSPYICTEEQNTLSEVVIEGQPLVESAVNSLSVLHDSCNIEHLDNEVRMQGNLDQSCRKEQPAGKSPLLAKSDDCTCSLNLPNTPSPTPTSLKYFVPHGLPYEEEISNALSRSPCQSTASLNVTVDAVLPPHPCLNELLLVKAGDVELNPGPLHGSIDDILQESELVQLAEEVPSDRITDLCNGLGFSPMEYQNVLTKHQTNIQGALIEFFSRWKAKQSDSINCRAVLAEILGKANMVVLQTKLLSGGYLTLKTPQSAPGQDTLHSLKDLTEEHAMRLIDAVLQDSEIVQLAKEVRFDYFFELCVHLGFSHTEGARVLNKHMMNSKEALIDLIFQWKAKQSYGTNYRAVLAEILGKADMVAIQTKLLSGGYLLSKTSLSAPGQDTLHSLKDLTEEHVDTGVLQDSELVQLATEVSGNWYTELCISLGFSYVESQNVLTKHLMDISSALIELFGRWKAKQRDGTNCRAVLAEILGKAHMIALQIKLLEGGYLPSKTSPSAPGQDTSPPLTREQVYRCGEDLRTFYCTQRCKIKTDPLDFTSVWELERIYTNLTLLRNEMGAETPIPIHYTRLFTTKMDGGLPKRFLVEGEGGVGKTTLCSRIACDWANGSREFQQFNWVLAIPVCDIMKGQTVGDIVKNYLSDSNTVTPYQIDNYILSQPSKVLIVLDGLDEYVGDLFAEEHSHISQILRLQKYKECIVLVTTRPWKAVQFKSDQVLSRSYAFLTLQGFSESDVSDYIERYFGDDYEAGLELINFIELSDIIKENMVPFPLYIAMLCTLWRDADSMKQATMHRLKTFSQLFDQMVTFLTDHYVTKLFGEADFKKEMERTTMALLQIGSIAFSGLLEKKLVFHEKDFISCKEAMEICHRIGVLSQEKWNIRRWERSHNLTQPLRTSVYFPHKLFQEYIAALHLASLYDTDREEYNRALNKVMTVEPEKFRYLLYFAAAQRKDIGLDIIENKIQQRGGPSHFLVDVTFEAYDQDLAILVGQRIFPDRKSVTVDGGMSAHTVAGYLFIMQQLETETLIVRDRSCGRTVSHDLGETLSSSSSLSRLEFCCTTLDEDFYQLMSRQGLQKSSVRELHIDDKFLDDLQRFNVTIEDLFPSLDQLYFTAPQPVSLGIIKHLAHSSLAVLSIGQCDLDDQQCLDGEVYGVPITGDPASVGQLFSSLFPHLTSLTFCKLVIGNIGSEAILHGLSDHLHLKSIGIIRCFTDDKLDPLARKISAEKGMDINLEHDMDCLPKIRMGNFRFSGASQEDLNSFLHSLTDYESDRAFSSAAEHVDTLADEKGKIGTELAVRNVGVVSTVQVKRESKLSTVEGIFGDLGGELHLDMYGFKLIIPPRALQKGTKEKICLGVLTNLPHDLILGDDEMIVSFGFSCLPSGLHFKEPVKLIIPHCAILEDPGKVEVVLYMWSRFTNGIERIPQCPGTCVVKQNHFELMLQHFTKGWLAILYDHLVIRGKSMLCMPYMPKRMPQSRKPVLEFRLEDDLPRQEMIMDDQTRRTQAMLDRKVDVFVERKDLAVSCQVEEVVLQTKTINQQILSKTKSQTLFFTLDLSAKPDETLVTLGLFQVTKLSEIQFNTQFIVLGSTPSREEEGFNSIVTQEQLDKIARKFPHGLYSSFCNKLGSEFNEAQAILAQHRDDYHLALMAILMEWKTRTGGHYSRLRDALRDSRAGALVAYIEPGTSPSTSNSEEEHAVDTRERSDERSTGAVRKRTGAQVHSSTDLQPANIPVMQQPEPQVEVPPRLKDKRQEKECSIILIILIILIIAVIFFVLFIFLPPWYTGFTFM